MRDPHTTGNGSSEWIEAHPEPCARSLDPNGHDFVARQAIFDRMGEVHGYELLFRLGSHNRFTGRSDVATRRMLGNYLLYGVGALTGSQLTFVNCSREALIGGWVSLLPRTNTVVELVETINPDEDVVSACRSLKQMGYRIALDDFQFSRKMLALLQLADYIKIDFRVPEKQRRKTLRELKGSEAKFVAEKVETEQELSTAFEEGFGLFEGFFLEAPRVFSRRKRPDGIERLPLLKAIAEYGPAHQEAEGVGEVGGGLQPQPT